MSKKSFDSSNELDFNVLQSASNERLNVPVTIYRGVHPQPLKTISLRDLLLEMVSDDISKIAATSAIVDSYEKYLSDAQKGIEGAKKPYEDKKAQLNGFSLGEFSYRNDKKENCLQYVSCFVFDLDGCKSREETALLQQKIKNLPYIFAAFPSPGGHGLRVFIWVSSTYEKHRILYIQALKTLCYDLAITTDKKNGFHFDSTCQNESRFFYYTPIDKKRFYLNLESILLVTAPKNTIFETNHRTENVKKVDVNELMVQLDGQLKGYFEGRNDRLFHLAMRFKNNDVSIRDAESYATKFVESDFSIKEILSSIRSAYKIATVQYSEAQKATFLGANEEHQGTSKSSRGKENDPQNAIAVQMKPTAESKKSIYRIIEKKLQKNYEIRYNTIAREIEFRKKSEKKEFYHLEDDGIHNLLRFLAEEGAFVSQKTLETSLYSDFAPRYNPIELYFESLPVWDEQRDFVHELCQFVVAKDQEWFEGMFRKMLVRCIACGLGKSENKHCFVLFGGQHNGKTKFLRYLCPPLLEKYRKENFKTDKDGIISLGQNFAIMLEELDKLKKDDWNALKAVFSMDYAKERPPFGRLPVYFQRIANFFGTCNKKEFLTDETGNVRWLIMEIIEILHDEGNKNGYKSINIDMVWAQAYHLFKNGFYFQLTKEDIAYSEAQNDRFKHVYAEKELINQYYTIPNDENRKYAIHQTSANILIRLQKLTALNNLKLSNIRKALQELGFSETQQLYKGRGYMVYEILQ